MVNCHEATKLALAAMDRPLHRGERIRLNLHRLLCAPCRYYKKQLELMRLCATRLRDGDETQLALPSTARERIRARLRATSQK